MKKMCDFVDSLEDLQFDEPEAQLAQQVLVRRLSRKISKCKSRDHSGIRTNTSSKSRDHSGVRSRANSIK